LASAAYGKDCDFAICKVFIPWTSIQTNMLELPIERLLSGAEGPHVTCFVVADEGFALNGNILRHFGGSNLSVKVCTTIACAEHECIWNMFLEF
jgi:hypothetical protein